MLEASTRWLAVRGDAIMNFLMISISAGAVLATQSPGTQRTRFCCVGLDLNIVTDIVDSFRLAIYFMTTSTKCLLLIESVFL